MNYKNKAPHFGRATLKLFMFLQAFGFSTLQAQELYKCGNTYSTKPCEGGSMILNNLPPITKVKSLPVPASSGEIPGQVTADEPIDPKIITDSPQCVVAPNGIRVAITDVIVRRREFESSTETIFIITIVNQSTDALTSPLKARIENPSGQSEIADIAPRLSSKQLTTYNHVVQTPKNGSRQLHSGTYRLALIYEPAESCPIFTVSASQATLVTNTNSGPASASISPVQTTQNFETLAKLESDLRLLAIKNPGSTRKTTSYRQEFNLLESNYRRLCNSPDQRLDIRMKMKCTSVVEVLRSALPR